MAAESGGDQTRVARPALGAAPAVQEILAKSEPRGDGPEHRRHGDLVGHGAERGAAGGRGGEGAPGDVEEVRVRRADPREGREERRVRRRERAERELPHAVAPGPVAFALRVVRVQTPLAVDAQVLRCRRRAGRRRVEPRGERPRRLQGQRASVDSPRERPRLEPEVEVRDEDAGRRRGAGPRGREPGRPRVRREVREERRVGAGPRAGPVVGREARDAARRAGRELQVAPRPDDVGDAAEEARVARRQVEPVLARDREHEQQLLEGAPRLRAARRRRAALLRARADGALRRARAARRRRAAGGPTIDLARDREDERQPLQRRHAARCMRDDDGEQSEQHHDSHVSGVMPLVMLLVESCSSMLRRSIEAARLPRFRSRRNPCIHNSSKVSVLDPESAILVAWFEVRSRFFLLAAE